MTLGEEIDALGQRRAHLDWRLVEIDKRTMQVMARVVDEEFRRLGLGRLKMADWLKTNELTFDEGMVVVVNKLNVESGKMEPPPTPGLRTHQPAAQTRY